MVLSSEKCFEKLDEWRFQPLEKRSQPFKTTSKCDTKITIKIRHSPDLPGRKQPLWSLRQKEPDPTVFPCWSPGFWSVRLRGPCEWSPWPAAPSFPERREGIRSWFGKAPGMLAAKRWRCPTKLEEPWKCVPDVLARSVSRASCQLFWRAFRCCRFVQELPKHHRRRRCYRRRTPHCISRTQIWAAQAAFQ